MSSNNTTEANSDGDDGGSFNKDDILNQIEDGANTLVDEATKISETNPNDWSKEQMVGVAVGSVVVILLLLFLYWCICRRQCCCKQRRNYSKSIPQIKIHRPYVLRAQTAQVADTDYNLPMGVKLHGALKLRQAGLLGDGIRVAVIDSGIDSDHPGFNNKVMKKKWYKYGTPLEEDDHGTHVAGTIHFMAPNASLYDYRVFGEQGDMDGDKAIAQAIHDCIDIDNCQIINMSLRVSYPVVAEVRQAIKYAYSKNVIMCCAAGNSGDGDPTTNEMYAYPALYDETISIAAVSKSNSDLPVAYFSESNPYIDYAGIGVEVLSMKPGGNYQIMQGTSMACPHVTGLITALMSGRDTKRFGSLQQLKQIIKKNYTIDIGAEGKDNSTGVGFATYLSKSEFDEFWKTELVNNGGGSGGGIDGYGAAQVY